MPRQLIDQLMKRMANSRAEDFIRLVFPDADFRVISTELDKELRIETREVDIAIKIVSKGKEHIFHIEFQTEYDPDISKRMFIYAAMLTAKYGLGVTSVLFQLRPPPKRARNLGTYQVKFFDRVTNRFSFQVVRLWEHREEIPSGRRPFLTFVPLLLEISEEPDENLLRKQRELIYLEEDLRRRLELLGDCLALASRHFDFNFLKTFFKEDAAMLEMLEDVPYIGEKIKQAKIEGEKAGEKRGEQRGEQKGRLEAIREVIFELLTYRFGVVDKEITQSLGTIDDPAILRIIFSKALQAESLEAFKTTTQKMVQALE